MLFIDNFDIAILNRQLKHCYPVVAHELGRDSATCQTRKFLRAAKNVLLCLNHAVLVTSSFGLYRNHELAPVTVNANIDFVDLDLPYLRYGSTQMILQ